MSPRATRRSARIAPAPSRPALLALALALTWSGACTPDFESVWLVKDLRILAMRAEPPELMVDEIPQAAFSAVHVDALVVDPTAPAGALVDWEIYACTPEKFNCDEAGTRLLVTTGRSAMDRIACDFVLTRELYEAALKADARKSYGGLNLPVWMRNGVPLMVELRVRRGGQTARGIKRLVYNLHLPVGKEPNRNPAITSVTANEAPIPHPWEARARTRITLEPQGEEGDKEKYVVWSLQQGRMDLEEYLSYAYYVTSGDISISVTGGDPSIFVTSKKVEDITSDWTPEGADAGTRKATIWIVVQDDRGGIGWVVLEPVVR